MKKVFLGGTCNGSLWREKLIPSLKIAYFNPALGVGEWNDAAAAKEIEERKDADFVLYGITPKMEGFFSIAELVEDAVIRPRLTIFIPFVVDGGDMFTRVQEKSILAVRDLILRRGAYYFETVEEVADFLNSKA